MLCCGKFKLKIYLFNSLKENLKPWNSCFKQVSSANEALLGGALIASDCWF